MSSWASSEWLSMYEHFPCSRRWDSGQLLREVLVTTLVNCDSSSVDPQVGQAGCFSPRSRIVIVTVNSF